MKIRFARSFSDTEELSALAGAGYDAAEFSLTRLMELGDDELAALRTRIGDSRIAPEVLHSPLPPQVRVTEDGFNIYVWSEYLKRAVERAAAVGCRLIVWNDGKARIVPVEGSTEPARRQALQFIFMLSDYARSHGIRVLVEPLDPRRTNYLNTMDEVAEFLAAAGRDNLGSVISLRDREAIGLDEAALSRYAELISHVYLEFPGVAGGSRVPPRQDDGYDYAPFLRSLAAIGYDGLISLPDSAGPDSLAYSRSLLNG